MFQYLFRRSGISCVPCDVVGKWRRGEKWRPTGIRNRLGIAVTVCRNAELPLVELRRRSIELPQQTVLRLETLATLAKRMRETVRRLSEDWETQSEHAAEQLEAHPS